MSCFRPATPGFLITLAATIILAIVSFGVPYLKSIYFLKASISVSGYNGTITFGTLGYCLEVSNGTTCSKPSVGYELDINGLVGNNLPVQIPQAVVKWLTYTLVLHIVALILSAGSTLFGLLAHVREISMTCCSTFVSGFAATIALVSFIFDIALFFVAKARISKVGSAQIGNAIWLTLAAWILLFFSGCFFSVGRCCISRRPRGSDGWRKHKDDHEEQLRLDAVKADAERKALQANPESGLPAFHEVQPLTARVDGDAVYLEPYKDSGSSTDPSTRTARTGYAPAPEGTRAVDEYYSSSPGVYPPAAHNPRRQNSSTTTTTTSVYPPSVPVTTTTSPPPQQRGYHDGYASTPYPGQPQAQAYGAAVAPSTPVNHYNSASYADPYNAPAAQAYSRGQQASSYSAIPIHQQQPTNSSNYYDPYTVQHGQNQASYHSYDVPYTSSPPIQAANAGSYFPAPGTMPQPHRSYSLGGGGYSSPPLLDHQAPAYQSPIPAPINANVGHVSPANTSPVKGPRAQPPSSSNYEEPLPGYDDGTGAWAR
ncbi:hypothetical protein AX15_005508 [Amanita polypyramis BW_CC]|nr:hypothetical protein AX15_005508 [Amanita polypyramis BW_CC]